MTDSFEEKYGVAITIVLLIFLFSIPLSYIFDWAIYVFIWGWLSFWAIVMMYGAETIPKVLKEIKNGL